MNVLISVNENYYSAAVIMLRSLFLNNRNCHSVVYLFHAELSSDRIEGLRHFIERNKAVLHVIKVNDDMLGNVPVGRLTKATYYRLLAPSLLPPDLDRILYLDIDMIVVGNIEKIYQSEFHGNYFMAAPDTSAGIDVMKKKLHMNRDSVYINAGVLLMNLDLLRKEFDLDEALGYAVKFPDRVPSCDQDVINALYHKRIGYLAWEYNYEARFHTITEILRYPFQLKRLLGQIKIIHYMGGEKPWKPGFNGKFLREYYRYARHTPYEESVRSNMRNRCRYILTLMGRMTATKIKIQLNGSDKKYN